MYRKTADMYILFFIAIGMLYFSQMLLSEQIFIGRDLGIYFLPPRYLWVQLVKSLELPLWNPYSFSGIPLLATLHPAIFYPPHLLYLFLPFHIVWNWLIILHFCFAGTTMYLLAGYLRASRIAAFVSGITFMLSGYLFSNHNLPTHLFAIPWTPLIILYGLKYMDASKLKYLVLTAALLTVQFFAGAPEITLMTGFLLLCTMTFCKTFGTTQRNRLFKVKSILLIFMLFFLLSAIQLVPFYELFLHNVRLTGLTFSEVTAWSLGWRDFLQFLLPDPFGYALNADAYWAGQSFYSTLYLGVLPLFLSTCYFLSRDRKRGIFLVLIGVSLLLALGRNTPLYKLLYHMPPFMSIRFPVKFIFLFFFVICLCAGFGFDYMREKVEQAKQGVRTAAYIFMLGGVSSFLILTFSMLFAEKAHGILRYLKSYFVTFNDLSFVLHYVRRILLFTFLFSTATFLYLKTRHKRVLSVALVTLLILDLFLINYNRYGSVSWSFFADKDRMKEYEFLRGNGETERYFVTPDTFNAFYSNLARRVQFGFYYSPFFGLYSIDGSEVLHIKDYVRFLNMLYRPLSTDQAKRLLDVSGIRFLITSTPIGDKALKERRLALVKESRLAGIELFFYEYKSYQGRFVLFNRVHHVKDEEAMNRALLLGGVDFRKELIIQSENEKSEVLKDVTGTVQLLSYAPNKVVLHSATDGDAYLYVSDTWYSGWRAYVDGNETRIYKANLAFRAVRIPAGQHTIVFRYLPVSLFLGLFLTVLGIVLSILLVLKREDQASETLPHLKY